VIREADRDNFRNVEKEWQWEFVQYVLSNLGIPKDLLDICFPEDMEDFSPAHKIELRDILSEYNVSVVDDRDGGIKIYTGEFISKDKPLDYLLVGEWKKCKFVYREDLTEVDPNLRIYVEVHADVWTTFDDGLEEE